MEREVLSSETESKGYYPLAQSHSSNQLQKKITTHPTQFDFFGNGTVEGSDFRLFVRGYKELVNGVNQSAAMLLDSLMIVATQDALNNTLVRLPLKEYMAMRGLRDEKEARLQVKRDIDALERVRFEYKGTGKQRGVWLKVSIAGGTVGQIKNGDILFRFNQDFFNSFKVNETAKYLYMYFPREALQGNIRRHPHKYWLARKISEHKRMNLGKSNENVIGVRTLIEACPNFPAYEEVMKSGKAISQRIIQPFERDLNKLSACLSWCYTGEKPGDYQSFIEASITIHWKSYPDTRKLKSGKAKQAKRQFVKKDAS